MLKLCINSFAWLGLHKSYETFKIFVYKMCCKGKRENNQLKSVEIIRISRLDFALISGNPTSGLYRFYSKLLFGCTTVPPIDTTY